jgi:hypothetical protein
MTIGYDAKYNGETGGIETVRAILGTVVSDLIMDGKPETIDQQQESSNLRPRTPSLTSIV